MTQHKEFETMGGLDLRSSKFQVSAGRLLDCLNIEVGRTSGYQTIEGFQGTDLRETIGLVHLYNFIVPGTGWGIANEDVMSFTKNGNAVVTMYCGNSEEVTSPPRTIITAISLGNAELEDFDTITIGTTIWGVTWDEVVGLGPVAVDGTSYVDLLANTQDHRFGGVSGRAGSHVLGLKAFKDELYAVRDMPAITVDTIAVTAGLEPVEGQRIYTATGSYSADIVDIQYIGGTFLAATAKATLILTNEWGVDDQHDSELAANTALYAATYTVLPYMGGGPMGFRYMGGPYAPTALTQFGTLIDFEGDTKAALWRGNEGFHPVYLNRELRFKSGGVELEELANYTKIAYTTKTTGDADGGDVTYSTISAAIPSAAVDVGPASGTGSAVTGIANLTADDGSYCTLATSSTARGTVWVHNYPLTTTTGIPIPSNATITGVTVNIQRLSSQATAARFVQDFTLRLTGVGSTSYIPQIPLCSANDKADRVSAWPTGETTRSYGGTNDLWGESSISVAQVNSGDFGVVFGFYAEDSGAGTTASIDTISIDISYINANGQAFVHNTLSAVTKTDIPIEVIKVTKTAGAFDDTTAEGIITIRGPSHYVARIAGTDATGAVDGRQISSGDVLYPQRLGAGTAYCTITGPDYPVTLPSESEMDAEESQYTWHVANFYATDGAETLYGANGAGPGFAWDGRQFIRIHTELLEKYNKPRHIIRHGASLAMFYRNGIGLFSGISDTGPDPLNFSTGVSNVVAREFGDRVHGVCPLADDVLAVFCQSKIVSLRGFVAVDFAEKVISPNSGAIEYTVVDMGFGNPFWLDNFGISTVSTTNRFGDFLAGRMSADVWPWLQPRVQDNGRFIDQRPRCAYPIRNKNQLRMPFNDGYILTMTLWGDQQIPMFTISRYQDYRATDTTDAAIYPVFAATSDVWTDGRERAFFSMAYTESSAVSLTGYTENKLRAGVYEIDTTAKFMNQDIQSFMTFNWSTMLGPTQIKRFNSFWLYGTHMGYATFDVSRKINYVKPGKAVSGAKRTVSVGSTSGDYEFESKPFCVHVDYPVEGFNVALRIDNYSAASFGALNIQGISITADDQGPSRGVGT